jgi:hypothetical protein
MSEIEDDPSIADGTDLWRRIHPEWIVQDESGRIRPSSQAFTNDPRGDPMSVYLEPQVRGTGRTAKDILEPYPGYSLASITAGLARANKQGVKPDPLPEEPAHGVVVGRKTGAVRRAFAKGASWVVAPAGH